MKKLFLVAVAGLFFAASSNAQVQRDTPQHQHMRSDSSHHFQRGKMMEQLNLTTDQQNQMKALQQETRQQREAIKNDQSLTDDQKKEKMKELHKTQSEKVNTILTPEQQAKMKTFAKQGRQGHNMRKNSNHVIQQLDLSADQKTQMKAVHENMQQQRQAIQNDTSLSADQKKDKMKELRKTQMEKMNTILTPEQQAKMKAFREQRRQNHRMHKMDNKATQSEQS